MDDFPSIYKYGEKLVVQELFVLLFLCSTEPIFRNYCFYFCEFQLLLGLRKILFLRVLIVSFDFSFLTLFCTTFWTSSEMRNFMRHLKKNVFFFQNAIKLCWSTRGSIWSIRVTVSAQMKKKSNFFEVLSALGIYVFLSLSQSKLNVFLERDRFRFSLDGTCGFDFCPLFIDISYRLLLVVEILCYVATHFVRVNHWAPLLTARRTYFTSCYCSFPLFWRSFKIFLVFFVRIESES